MNAPVLRAHGEAGVVPAAKDAEAFELDPQAREELSRVLAAGEADFELRKFGLFAAEILVDFEFDGQTVAVPTGDVGRVEAGHGFGLDDGCGRWRRAACAWRT